MSDSRGGPTLEAAESRQASPIEGIEEDLDTVDAALAALDSGDLEGAETLAAKLGARADDESGPAHEEDSEA